MTIVPCPRCHERVSLPLSASAQARVRCPLCQDSMLLAEILETLPPELEVLDDPGRPISEPAEVGEPRPAGAEPWVAGEPSPAGEVRPSLPEFSIDRSSQARDASPPAAGVRRRTSRSRGQRKSKSAVWEVAKIAAGGIAGLIMAQLLLWWMPWQNLRRDPFEIGPSVASLAPWLVPATFHGNAAAADAAAPGTAPTEPENGVSATGLPERTFDDRGAAAEFPSPEADDELPIPSETWPAPGQQDPDGGIFGHQPLEHDSIGELEIPPIAGEDPGDLEDLYDLGPTLTEPDTAPDDQLPLDPDWELDSELDPGLETDPILELDPDLETDPELETDPGLEMESEPAPETVPAPDEEPDAGESAGAGNENEGDVVATLTDATETNSTPAWEAVLKEAQQAAAAWSEIPAADSGPLLASTYRAFARLAQAITDAEPGARQDREAAIALVQALREDPAKLNHLGRAGVAWINAPDRRDSQGVVLVGHVRAVLGHGPFYRTELALPDNKTVAPVYANTDPAEWYRVEDRVLIAGAIIPSASLSELPRDAAVESEVVWGSVAALVTD